MSSVTAEESQTGLSPEPWHVEAAEGRLLCLWAALGGLSFHSVSDAGTR